MSNKPHACNPFADVERCGAKTRNDSPCRCPAMKNGRCRLHGGLSTGPKTREGRARCGNWKHGMYSKASIEKKALVGETLKKTMLLIEALEV